MGNGSPFTLKVNNKYTFQIEISPNVWLELTCKFLRTEQMDYRYVRQALRDMPENEKKLKKKELKEAASKGTVPLKTMTEVQADDKAINTYMLNLRKSMVSLTHGDGTPILDEDTGEPVVLVNEDGSINEEEQMAVFDWVKANNELFEKVNLANGGEVDSKNLKIGLLAPSNLVGVQTNAQVAISDESAKDASSSHGDQT